MEKRTIPEWTLADRCRKARSVAGLGQGELAARVQVSRNTIANYENARISRPGPLTLTAWAEVCGVDRDWLVNGDSAHELAAAS